MDGADEGEADRQEVEDSRGDRVAAARIALRVPDRARQEADVALAEGAVARRIAGQEADRLDRGIRGHADVSESTRPTDVPNRDAVAAGAEHRHGVEELQDAGGVGDDVPDQGDLRRRGRPVGGTVSRWTPGDGEHLGTRPHLPHLLEQRFASTEDRVGAVDQPSGGPIAGAQSVVEEVPQVKGEGKTEELGDGAHPACVRRVDRSEVDRVRSALERLDERAASAGRSVTAPIGDVELRQEPRQRHDVPDPRRASDEAVLGTIRPWVQRSKFVLRPEHVLPRRELLEDQSCLDADRRSR